LDFGNSRLDKVIRLATGEGITLCGQGLCSHEIQRGFPAVYLRPNDLRAASCRVGHGGRACWLTNTQRLGYGYRLSQFLNSVVPSCSELFAQSSELVLKLGPLQRAFFEQRRNLRLLGGFIVCTLRLDIHLQAGQTIIDQAFHILRDFAALQLQHISDKTIDCRSTGDTLGVSKPQPHERAAVLRALWVREQHLKRLFVELSECLLQLLAPLGEIRKQLLIVHEELQTVVIRRQTACHTIDGLFRSELVDARFIELVQIALRHWTKVGSSLKVWRRQEGVQGRQQRNEKGDASDQNLLSPKRTEQFDQVNFIVR